MFQFIDEDHLHAVYNAYNFMSGPVSVAAYALAWVAFILAVWRKPISDRYIAFYLSALWLWLGFVFHMVFTGVLSFASYLVGAFFLLEGTFFFKRGLRPALTFSQPPTDGYTLAGVFLALYALVVYPFLGVRFGAGLPNTPAAGLSPGAGVAFTLGLLLMTSRPCPQKFIWVPFLASMLGSSLAFFFGFAEDKPLVFLGFAAAWLAGARIRQAAPPPAPQSAALYG